MLMWEDNKFLLQMKRPLVYFQIYTYTGRESTLDYDKTGGYFVRTPFYGNTMRQLNIVSWDYRRRASHCQSKKKTVKVQLHSCCWFMLLVSFWLTTSRWSIVWRRHDDGHRPTFSWSIHPSMESRESARERKGERCVGTLLLNCICALRCFFFFSVPFSCFQAGEFLCAIRLFSFRFNSVYSMCSWYVSTKISVPIDFSLPPLSLSLSLFSNGTSPWEAFVVCEYCKTLPLHAKPFHSLGCSDAEWPLAVLSVDVEGWRMSLERISVVWVDKR